MSSSSLSPSVLARIERLEFQARGIVEGFIAGLHRSPFHGFSVEFSQYRGYVPGDDLKHLDWKVYGRSERYAIKQYEEETNLVCYLVVDGSESMAYASDAAARDDQGAPLSKLQYAKTAAAALAHLVLGQSDAAALAVVDDRIADFVERSTRDAHLHRICASLDAIDPVRRKSGLGTVLQRLCERIRRRSIVVLISDLFDDPAGILRGLQRLRHAGSEVVVLHLLDPQELSFAFDGLIQFQGLEDAGTVLCQPRLIRAEYLAELERFLTRMKAVCLKSGVDYAQISTATPVAQALTAYLGSRERLTAHGARR